MLKVRIEAGLSLLAAGLAAITMLWPAWLEAILPIDPDGGSGEAEWLIVMALALVAVASALLAMRHHGAARRRAPISPEAAPET
ncbi:MAG: hypothetical protein ACOH2F_08905 [Cellulomonas sp.]